eukprot:COSAG05_NODE_2035_length_3659_cov_3.394101_4_plen_375_part_00
MPSIAQLARRRAHAPAHNSAAHRPGAEQATWEPNPGVGACMAPHRQGTAGYAPLATEQQQQQQQQQQRRRRRRRRSPPQHPQQPPQQQLRQELTLLDATAIVVGNIVGTGIFSSPGVALEECGSVGFSLVAWAIGGLLATSSSLVYAELGSMMPAAGGDFVYISAAFGSRVAFMWAVGQFTVYRPTSLAVSGLVVGRYTAAMLLPHEADATATGDSSAVEKLIAALFVFLLSAFNVLPVGVVARVQTAVVMLAKPVLVLGLVALAVTFSTRDTAVLRSNFDGAFSDVKIEGLAPSIFASLFAYNGWHNMPQMAEEMKEPQRQLPRALVLGMATVTVTYLLLNLSYLAVRASYVIMLIDSALRSIVLLSVSCSPC